jgi:hypothetical protein
MNFQNILGAIEQVDPEVYDRLDTRRHAMQRFSRIGSRIALAAVPMAIGSMFKKAYGQSSNPAVKGILQYALGLEYIEEAFYNRGVTNAATIGIPTGAPLTAITKIRDDESKHVAFLKSALTTGFAATPADIASPNIDLTGGKSAQGTGPFAPAYQANGYLSYLAVAQTFEDTGVRAYKGRAKEITKGGPYLTAALQIHSVEARHAAHIRYMRSAVGGATIPAGQTVKPWITQAQSGITVGNASLDAAIGLSYGGASSENTATQAGVAITNIGGQSISANAATEAFDEPLTMTEVSAIVSIFIY